MVGVISIVHQIATVAVFATLLAAIQVNGERGCTYDFEKLSDFDTDCNELKNSWTSIDDVKDPKRRVLFLTPEQDGCLRTKSLVMLNSTTPVSIRFYREAIKTESGKLKMRLLPKDGNCPDEECVWDITSDSQYKPGEWVTVEYKFPLKAPKECYIQVQADKSKGKLLLDQLSLPSGCSSDEGLRAAYEAGMNVINVPSQLVGTGNNKSSSPGYAEIAKNLMLTSASVLTLNNLIN